MLEIGNVAFGQASHQEPIFAATGWQCPQCKAIMSPTTPVCPYCKPRINQTESSNQGGPQCLTE